MLTEEELRQLAEAGSIDELLELLQSFIDAGTISETQADELIDQYAGAVEGVEPAPVAPVATGGFGQDLASLRSLPNELLSALRNRPPASFQPPTRRTQIPRIGTPEYQNFMLGIKPPKAPAKTPELDPQVMPYLEQYTSKNDLAGRISQLLRQGIISDETEASRLYNEILGIRPSASLEQALAQAKELGFGVAEAQAAFDQAQAAQTRSAGMAIRAGTARTKLPEPTAAQLAQQKAGTLLQPGTDFETTMAKLGIAPGTPEYTQKRAERQMALETIQGKRPDMQDRQAQIDAEQTRLTAIDKQRSEGQTADALMAMLNRREITGVPRLTRIEGLTGERFYDMTGERPFERPPIPSEFPIAESALKATGYGEGTKLRNFIASQIAETTERMRPERKAWWERMTAPPPPEEQTYEDALASLTATAEKWQAVAGVAPSSEVAGGTAYGPGGLKAIAEQVYADTQKRIAGLDPGLYGTRTPYVRPEEEDPLVAALKKRRFSEEYYRLPGTGTVPRLQRAVRFR